MEYFPKGKKVWLLFDLSNGHRITRRYVWWFDTKKEAKDFRKEHVKQVLSSELSKPVPYKSVNKKKKQQQKNK